MHLSALLSNPLTLSPLNCACFLTKLLCRLICRIHIIMLARYQFPCHFTRSAAVYLSLCANSFFSSAVFNLNFASSTKSALSCSSICCFSFVNIIAFFVLSASFSYLSDNRCDCATEFHQCDCTIQKETNQFSHYIHYC